MLHDAGILRHECFITNVVHERPPGNDITHWIPDVRKKIVPGMVQCYGRMVDARIPAAIARLHREVLNTRPEVIIVLGNTALWALTQKSGIKKWRGSRLTGEFGDGISRIIVPTYHPTLILRQYELRPIAVLDLKRAAAARSTDQPPEYRFLVRPTFAQAMLALDRLAESLDSAPRRLAVDVETRSGHIACIAFAMSALEAFCIPLMDAQHAAGYWSLEEEALLVARMRAILEHPNAQVIGQNFLYDTQYLHRHWRCVPNVVRDTMAAEHLMFAGHPKALDYLSSKYCHWHVYWKDESKDWDPKVGEDQLWIYNCKDAVATFEIDEAQQQAVDRMGLREQHDWHQAKFWMALDIMLRGMRRDPERTSATGLMLLSEQETRTAWLTTALGHEININSPAQMKRLFYEDLQQQPIINRKSGTVSTDEDALHTIVRRQPLLKPLVNKVLELRTIGKFLSTYVNASPSWDGRMRTQFNPFGPETFRAASSTDAFDSGMNLQNIPSGGEKEDSDLVLPNIRSLFIPDRDRVMLETDLDRADLQVVVWEAEDDGLKRALRNGLDMHLFNARDIFNLSIPDDELIDGTEACKEHKLRYKDKRHRAKAGCHATNYGVKGRTLAHALGSTVHEADMFIARWFAAHPGIKRWQDRTLHHITTRRYVENRFGFRRYYFGRAEEEFNEALAWTPQSTVAEVINRIWWKVLTELPWVEVLLQVHDSILTQCPTWREGEARAAISHIASRVIVPYDDPLCIPVGTKSSTVSWGDVK